MVKITLYRRSRFFTHTGVLMGYDARYLKLLTVKGHTLWCKKPKYPKDKIEAIKKDGKSYSQCNRL